MVDAADRQGLCRYIDNLAGEAAAMMDKKRAVKKHHIGADKSADRPGAEGRKDKADANPNSANNTDNQIEL